LNWTQGRNKERTINTGEKAQIKNTQKGGDRNAERKKRRRTRK